MIIILRRTKLTKVSLTLTDEIKGTIVAITTSDNNGYYQFTKIGNGSYTIQSVTNEAVGGIDPTDALLINEYYIKLYQFVDDLKKQAGSSVKCRSQNKSNRRFTGRKILC